jgi:hypothetical protein
MSVLAAVSEPCHHCPSVNLALAGGLRSISQPPDYSLLLAEVKRCCVEHQVQAVNKAKRTREHRYKAKQRGVLGQEAMSSRQAIASTSRARQPLGEANATHLPLGWVTAGTSQCGVEQSKWLGRQSDEAVSSRASG